MQESEVEGPRHPRIEDQVLALLSETTGTIAFGGLRRTLAVHPESLVRALRRLERAGAIVRSGQGYALRDPIVPRPDGAAPARTVATVRLPPGVSGTELLGRLAGRWLGPLRWLGVYDHPGDPWLVWTVAGGRSHAMLSSEDGLLQVRTDGPEDDSGSDDAAFALLGRALEEVRRPAAPSRAPTVAPLAREPADWELN